MVLPELKRIKVDDENVNVFQGYVREYFGLINAPFFRGRYLTTLVDGQESEIITLTSSAQLLNHKLGQKPIGFLVLDRLANQTIWRVAGTEDQTLFINLQASGTVQCRIWVF